MEFEVNFLAVLVAVVAHQVLGFIWYGVIFQKTWLAAMGKSREEVQDAGSRAQIVAVIGSVLTALVLAIFLGEIGELGPAEGIVMGFLAGVGFATASLVTTGAFEEKNPTLTYIFSGYQTAGLMAMGGILAAMS